MQPPLSSNDTNPYAAPQSASVGAHMASPALLFWLCCPVVIVAQAVLTYLLVHIVKNSLLINHRAYLIPSVIALSAMLAVGMGWLSGRAGQGQSIAEHMRTQVVCMLQCVTATATLNVLQPTMRWGSDDIRLMCIALILTAFSAFVATSIATRRHRQLTVDATTT